MKRQLLTSAKTDRELINLWLGRKSRTTQISYRAIIGQFLDFVRTHGLGTRTWSRVRWQDNGPRQAKAVVVAGIDKQALGVA